MVGFLGKRAAKAIITKALENTRRKGLIRGAVGGGGQVELW